MQKILLIGILVFYSLIARSQFTVPDLSLPVINGTDSLSGVLDFTTDIWDHNKVALKWRVADSLPAEYFTVERSANGSGFTTMCVLKLQPGSRLMGWRDEAPEPGKNYYRISYLVGPGRKLASRAILTVITGDVTVRFYPNPVDNILIVRSDIPVDVMITDAMGKLKLNSGTIQGLQTLNVSDLEKGIYLIRITNKLTNTITQEKLIKN